MASVPQRDQLASTPEPPGQKEKEQSRLSRGSDRKMGESKGEREPHLGEREKGDKSGSMDRKGWTPQ